MELIHAQTPNYVPQQLLEQEKIKGALLVISSHQHIERKIATRLSGEKTEQKKFYLTTYYKNVLFLV